MPAREPVAPRDRPDDPRQERHPGVKVGKIDLCHADPREDVGHRAQPRPGDRSSEQSAAEESSRFPPRSSEGPGRSASRSGTAGSTAQDAPGTSHPRSDWARAAARPRSPASTRDPAAGIGAVHRLFHRQVVDDQVAAREVAPEKERIGVHRNDQKPEEGRGEETPTRSVSGSDRSVTKLYPSARRRLSRRRRPAAERTKRSGPKRDTSHPGIRSRQSTTCRPPGIAIAENASCAGTGFDALTVETDRPVTPEAAQNEQVGRIECIHRQKEAFRAPFGNPHGSGAGGGPPLPAGLDDDRARTELPQRVRRPGELPLPRRRSARGGHRAEPLCFRPSPEASLHRSGSTPAAAADPGTGFPTGAPALRAAAPRCRTSRSRARVSEDSGGEPGLPSRSRC